MCLLVMDFSSLDLPFEIRGACVPGEWKISSDSKPLSEHKKFQTMEDLLNDSVHVPQRRSDPKAAFDIPKVKCITPELKLELAAIRLRRFAYKDKFIKGSDTKDIPTRFQIGTVVGGGLVAVGGGSESQAAGTVNRKKKSGKSHLMSLLKDDTVKNWLHKNIEKRHNVARPKSRHPKIRKNRH